MSTSFPSSQTSVPSTTPLPQVIRMHPSEQSSEPSHCSTPSWMTPSPQRAMVQSLRQLSVAPRCRHRIPHLSVADHHRIGVERTARCSDHFHLRCHHRSAHNQARSRKEDLDARCRRHRRPPRIGWCSRRIADVTIITIFACLNKGIPATRDGAEVCAGIAVVVISVIARLCPSMIPLPHRTGSASIDGSAELQPATRTRKVVMRSVTVTAAHCLRRSQRSFEVLISESEING